MPYKLVTQIFARHLIRSWVLKTIILNDLFICYGVLGSPLATCESIGTIVGTGSSKLHSIEGDPFGGGGCDSSN